MGSRNSVRCDVKRWRDGFDDEERTGSEGEMSKDREKKVRRRI